jgi:hypothetical protein
VINNLLLIGKLSLDWPPRRNHFRPVRRQRACLALVPIITVNKRPFNVDELLFMARGRCPAKALWKK